MTTVKKIVDYTHRSQESEYISHHEAPHKGALGTPLGRDGEGNCGHEPLLWFPQEGVCEGG